MAQKKEVKVGDLKPSKDAKGGAARNLAGRSQNTAGSGQNQSSSRNNSSRNNSSRTTL